MTKVDKYIKNMIRLGITELYCGASGKTGFYNSQEIGLAKAMKKLGYDCYIFYPLINSNSIMEEIIEPGIRVVNCPAYHIGTHSGYDWTILKQYHIDAVQVNSDTQFFAPGLIKYCDRNNIVVYSYIGTVTSDTAGLKGVVSSFLFKRNLASYRKHMNFAKTEAVRRKIESLGVENAVLAHVGLDITIIPDNSVSITELKRRYNLPSNQTILLYVGRIDQYKNPNLFIDLLYNLGEDYYGIIIGDGKMSTQIEWQIHQLNISTRVRWIKKLPNAEIHDYYCLADYFLNFNDQEIFGMSILEAMYHGCAVIAFHAPGPDEIIENEKSGFLVNNCNEMRQIISKGQLIQKGEAQSRILQFFSWNITAEIIDKWIKSCFV